MMPVDNTPWNYLYLADKSHPKVEGPQPRVGVSDSAEVLVNSLKEQMLDRTYWKQVGVSL